MSNMPDSYPLGRDTTESTRLNTQHEIWQKNLNYLIHPSIESQLRASKTSPRIADVGTGSGAYLLDLSTKSPSAWQFQGFDISAAQFPTVHVPANVSFTMHDARAPFPPELHGTFDMVNLRSLVTALDKDDWDLVLSNAIALLVPGGGIQWTEADTMGSLFLRGDHVLVPSALPLLADYFWAGMGHRLQHGHKTMPEVFKSKGLEKISQDIVASDRVRETRTVFTRISYDAIVGWALHYFKLGVPGAWSPEEVARVRKLCEDEICAGAYCRFELYTTIGFVKGI